MDTAFWNGRYAVASYYYGESANGFVAATASHIPAGPVLCLAEGEGRNAVHLATLGHRVLAVDQSDVGLDKARRLAATRGVEIETMVADLANYRITPNTWAGIVAIFAHLPPALRRQVHAHARRDYSVHDLPHRNKDHRLGLQSLAALPIIFGFVTVWLLAKPQTQCRCIFTNKS